MGQQDQPLPIRAQISADRALKEFPPDPPALIERLKRGRLEAAEKGCNATLRDDTLDAIIARLERADGEIDGWKRQTENLRRLITDWSRLSPEADRERDGFSIAHETLLARHVNRLRRAKQMTEDQRVRNATHEGPG